ncbi:MAG: macro domain-containing protein [Candidatus Aenigmarchaeota archaeon]|nr:macro domain-containing protein [Candidatus Aenigmarchaeota archaeon]
MITFVTGNLFDSAAQVLTNTVNCVGAMGKGVALEFKNRYPAMFEEYRRRCERGEVRPGEPYLWEDDRVQILNFPTKRDWRENSRLEDIALALKYLATHYQNMGIQSLAMPALGCGQGGLRWEDVRPLIEKHLGDLTDLDVYVYEPAAVAAEQNPPHGTKKKVGSDSDSIAAQPSLPL